MGDISARGQARTHADGDKATMYKKKPRSLTLVLDSFVPSARVMDREKIAIEFRTVFVYQAVNICETAENN